MLDTGQVAGTFLRRLNPLSFTFGIGRIVHPSEKFQTKANLVSAVDLANVHHLRMPC